MAVGFDTEGHTLEGRKDKGIGVWSVGFRFPWWEVEGFTVGRGGFEGYLFPP